MSTKLSVFCDKVVEAGWLVAIIVVPLFFNVYSSRVFEPDKLTLLRSIALVMAVAWVINADWLPSDLVHSPIVTDNYTFSFDNSRHFIRSVNFVHRDPIFRDFFTKLDKQK